MRPFDYAEPAELAAALALAKDPKAALKAGGLDLLDLMKGGVAAPSRLVSIQKLPGMREIRGIEGALALGALATLAEVAKSKLVREKATAVAEAAEGAATPQIRNVATVAGNLLQRPRCWYFRGETWNCLRKGGERCYATDGENRYHAIFETEPCCIVNPSNLAPALIALGAQAQVRTGATTTEGIPVEALYIAPADDPTREHVFQRDDRRGQVIEAITIAPVPGRRSAYLEAREKQSFDWAVAAAAVALVMDGETCKEARVVLGAVAPRPRRAEACEKLLAGQKLTDDAIAKAAKAALAGATPLSQNAYKVPLAEAVVRRAIRAAAGRA